MAICTLYGGDGVGVGMETRCRMRTKDKKGTWCDEDIMWLLGHSAMIRLDIRIMTW